MLAAARAAGVQLFVTVGTDAEHSRRAIEIAGAHDDVWATVGLHPHDATQGVAGIEPLLGQPKVVAVGEVRVSTTTTTTRRATCSERPSPPRSPWPTSTAWPS